MIQKALCLGILMAALKLATAAESTLPPFSEVYDLLKTNLAGIDENQLNKAAVEGFLTALEPKVSLVSATNSGSQSDTNSFKSTVFDNAYGYFRLGPFANGAQKKLLGRYKEIAATNRLKGLIFDLRYSQGHDYAGAAELAEIFFNKEAPLIDWGEGMKNSSTKTNAVELPITILVNRKTSGAAEAFAAILRQGHIGLILGTNTAGHAAISKEFTLSTGQKLRVATTPIKLADGKPFPMTGLKPDISIEVHPDDELAWFEDAYKQSKPVARIGSGTNELASALTNRSARRRMNEAELVRMLREGLNPDSEIPLGPRDSERSKTLISDPVLARALDLLKGLSVVQQFRSS